MPLASFYTSWKHQMLWGGIEEGNGMEWVDKDFLVSNFCVKLTDYRGLRAISKLCKNVRVFYKFMKMVSFQRFMGNDIFLYPLQTFENQRISDVFSWYGKRKSLVNLWNHIIFIDQKICGQSLVIKFWNQTVFTQSTNMKIFQINTFL